MQYAIIFAALAGSAIASPAIAARNTDTCVEKCNAAYNTCRTGPDANMATCASQYSTCLGYLPFASNGTLITPTACSTTASSTAKPTSTYSPCEQVYYDCVAANNKGAAGSPNFAVCAASSAACQGTATGSMPTPTADACVAKCQAQRETCQSKPDANQSTCAAEQADCLGYAPYVNGTYVAPTACSGTALVTPTGVAYTTKVVTSFTTYCPAPTTLTYNSKTYTVTSATTLTITDCPCTITTPVVAVPTGPANNGNNNEPVTTYTTVTLSSITTYCPAPTTLTVGPVTMAIPSPGTYTIPIVTVTAVSGTPTVQGGAAPSGTQPAVVGATTNPAVFQGAAAAVKPAMAVLALGAISFFL